jgi:flagellar protein FlaG
MEDIRIPKISGPPTATSSLPKVASGSKIKTEIASGDTKDNTQSKEPIVPVEVNLEQLVQEANQIANSNNKEINFEFDKEGDPPVIVVSDKETGEVIRQIPSEEMVRLNDNMEEFVGLIFDRRY